MPFPGDTKICAEREFIRTDNFEDKFEVAWKFAVPYINESLDDQGSKSVVDSIHWRTTGNDEYTATLKNKDYLCKSIEAYTKSIAYAPVGSTELSLAYANRSAVLCKARLYEDCLVDIERALTSGYPDNLKTKLFVRQAWCFKALKPDYDIDSSSSIANAMQWLPNLKENNPNYNIEHEHSKMMNELGAPRDIIKFLPEIKKANSIIVDGSDAIDLKITNTGQHIIAKKMIKSGEFIYISEPFSATVIDELRFTNCWHCCRRTLTGVPCDNCPAIIYCSDTCKKKAWDSYHNIECLVLGQLLKIDKINIADLLAIKTFLKALNSVDSLSELNEQIDNIDSIKNTGFMFSHGKLDANSIDNYRYLDYFKATSTECTFESALLAVLVVAIFGQKTEILGKKMTLKDLTESKIKNIFNLGKLILRYTMVVRRNSPHFIETETEDSSVSSSVMIPFCRLLKKSCDPNVDWTYVGSNVGFYAIKPIKQGKQILLSTAGSYHLTPRIDRYIRLAPTTTDYIPCKCKACDENWPTIQFLQSYESMSSNKIRMLSKKIKAELDSMMQEFKECQELFEEGDNTKLLTIKDTLSSINDKFHHYINVPCKEISHLYLLLKKLYVRLHTVHDTLE
ncbi:SET and MYND domain-containing protein 4-like [Aphidius gifuensis]|uniref:SET and MYND domain-containing protein 4-like n=1 Tax=Aphidius gifuensis TaxID=684658 RepID=UPI001CDC2F0B|nr:SET and MYND domain-containing protein 4-like [Aphidius gifuensis]